MTEIVKAMLKEDIGLKENLNKKFKKIMYGLVIIIVILSVLFYFLITYYRKNVEVMRVIVDEKGLIQRQRDSLRFEKEIFYRIRDTSLPYVRPMYDTININSNGDTK